MHFIPPQFWKISTKELNAANSSRPTTQTLHKRVWNVIFLQVLQFMETTSYQLCFKTSSKLNNITVDDAHNVSVKHKHVIDNDLIMKTGWKKRERNSQKLEWTRGKSESYMTRHQPVCFYPTWKCTIWDTWARETRTLGSRTSWRSKVCLKDARVPDRLAASTTSRWF